MKIRHMRLSVAFGHYAMGAFFVSLCIVMLSLLPSVLWLINEASTAVSDSASAANVATSTMAALNAPCVDFHGDYICGPIPQLSQTEKNIGILAAQSAKQVKQSSRLVDAAADSVQTLTVKAGATMDTAKAQIALVGPLLASGTGLLDEGKKTLQITNDPKAGLPAILAGATLAESNLNGYLMSQAVKRMVTNLSDLTGDLNGTAANLQVTSGYVNTYLQPILAPQPCPKKGHLGCVLKRHVWGTFMTVAKGGEALYWSRQNF